MPSPSHTMRPMGVCFSVTYWGPTGTKRHPNLKLFGIEGMKSRVLHGVIVEQVTCSKSSMSC